ALPSLQARSRGLPRGRGDPRLRARRGDDGGGVQGRPARSEGLRPAHRVRATAEGEGSEGENRRLARGGFRHQRERLRGSRAKAGEVTAGPHAAPNKPTQHRVLIVDDEESMRLFLARILARTLKLEVTLAGTCEQALRLAGNYAYDAILLDLLMPGVGGFEVLKELRTRSPNTATPIIIVSVLAEQSTRDRCMAAGANAYIVKPPERNALVATVKAQIAGRMKPKAAS